MRRSYESTRNHGFMAGSSMVITAELERETEIGRERETGRKQGGEAGGGYRRIMCVYGGKGGGAEKERKIEGLEPDLHHTRITKR